MEPLSFLFRLTYLILSQWCQMSIEYIVYYPKIPSMNCFFKFKEKTWNDFDYHGGRVFGELLIFHTYICDRDNHHRVLLFWESHPGDDRVQCLLQVTLISSANSGNTQRKGDCRHRSIESSFRTTEENIIYH